MILLITDIDVEHLEGYYARINTLEEKEPLTIVIESDGGSNTIGENLSYIFEELRKTHEVDMIGIRICSTGFLIFKNFKGKKMLHENSFGMIHLTSWGSVQYRDGLLVTSDYNKFVIQEQKKRKPQVIKGLTAEQNRRYKKGEDIWLNKEELTKIMGL